MPALQARFAPVPATMPAIVVSLPPVASYDVLLSLRAVTISANWSPTVFDHGRGDGLHDGQPNILLSPR